MTTKVEKTILVNVPISTAYNQWTQFEDFPQFMNGVSSVTQLGENRLHWVAEIAGVKREWDAQILEQVPDEKVAWAATSGATNAGAVFFSPAGDQTSVRLSLEYEPEGLLEKVGDKLNFVEKQAEGDLEKFKSFIEDAGYASGAWRGTVPGSGVGTPTVQDAAGSEGDSGKAGVSAKAVVAGVAAAAAGVAAAGAMKSRSGGDETETDTQSVTTSVPTEVTTTETVTPVTATEPVTPLVVEEPLIVDEPLTTTGTAGVHDQLDGLTDSELPATGMTDKPFGSR